MLGERQIPCFRGGSTAIVALVRADCVYVACVGDSRCVLGELNAAAEAYGVKSPDDGSAMWTAHALSVDQKPDLPEERVRLEAHGAEVRQTEPGGPSRAVAKTSNYMGQGGSFRMALAMSRSLGDYVRLASASSSQHEHPL